MFNTYEQRQSQLPGRCGARRVAASAAAAGGGGAPSPTSSIDGGALPRTSSPTIPRSFASTSSSSKRGAGAGATNATASTASIDVLDGSLDDLLSSPEFIAAAATAASTISSSSTPASTSSSSHSGSAQAHRSHGGRDASLTSVEEQERELLAVTTALPRAETRLEALALWVGAAVAFGGGIWYTQGAEKAQEYFAG